MSGANILQRFEGILGEAGFGIGAEKREFFFLTEFVPQVLEPHGRRVLTPVPEDRDHLTERPNTPPVVSPRAAQDALDHMIKLIVIRPSVIADETVKGLFRIKLN